MPRVRRNSHKREDRIEQLIVALDLSLSDLFELARQAADRVGLIVKARKTANRRRRAGKKR